jgi:hypothetical protein
MKTLKLSLLAIFIISATACKKDFLQRDVGIQTDIEKVFQDPLLASRYADNSYTFSINDYGRLSGYKGMTSQFTDESIANNNQIEVAVMNRGLFLDGGASDVNTMYTQMYRGIRNVNVTLANMDKTQWTADFNANYIKGEQLYLRAYFYSELIKRYGGVVLLTQPQNFTEAADDQPRASFDATLNQYWQI